MTLGRKEEVWLMKRIESEGKGLRKGPSSLLKASDCKRVLTNGFWNELWAYFQAASNHRRVDKEIY